MFENCVSHSLRSNHCKRGNDAIIAKLWQDEPLLGRTGLTVLVLGLRANWRRKFCKQTVSNVLRFRTMESPCCSSEETKCVAVPTCSYKVKRSAGTILAVDVWTFGLCGMGRMPQGQNSGKRLWLTWQAVAQNVQILRSQYTRADGLEIGCLRGHGYMLHTHLQCYIYTHTVYTHSVRTVQI